MNDAELKLIALKKSKFRSSFYLKKKDLDYIQEKGLSLIQEHAYDFINKRLKILLENDGKQTPYHGHPVFIAEHATATCCRSCLYKWYGIPKNHELTNSEIDYIVDIIMLWIKKEISNKRGKI